MDEIMLSRINDVYNDVNIGTRKSYGRHEPLIYFVEVIYPKDKTIDRWHVTKKEFEEVDEICRRMLKEKIKLKAKEKRQRHKLALVKKQKKLEDAKEPVELDEIDEITEVGKVLI